MLLWNVYSWYRYLRENTSIPNPLPIGVFGGTVVSFSSV